jgi:hypothetical protein
MRSGPVPPPVRAQQRAEASRLVQQLRDETADGSLRWTRRDDALEATARDGRRYRLECEVIVMIVGHWLQVSDAGGTRRVEASQAALSRLHRDAWRAVSGPDLG